MVIKRIAIIGGGLAGWMIASALSRTLHPHHYSIVVVEGKGEDISMGPYTSALSSLPTVRSFHAAFGYDEDEILVQSKSCFSLGTAYSGWTASGAACFHGLGDLGAPLGQVSFHHLAARLRAEGDAINLADHTLAALCAQTHRFIRPPHNTASVLSTLDYGLLLGTRAYIDFFKRDALSKHVTVQYGRIKHVSIKHHGLIDALSLDTGEAMSADLFIDCTGDKAEVISAMPGVEFHSWGQWLPCDHMINRQSPANDHPAPYVHIEAADNGWNRFIQTPGQAYESIIFKADEKTRLPPDAQSFSTGHRSTFWQGNCVALGAAAVVIDPLSPLPLYLLQSAIQRLVTLFPHEKDSPVEARNFNAETQQEIDAALEFAILPYKINGRVGAHFWDECRLTPSPERLQHRIDVYKATGRVSMYDGDFMEEADWIAFYDAQRLYPARYDPAANAFDLNMIRSHFARIRDIMINEVRRIPLHHDYLKALYS
jgi:tryptophan 7-halogenase